MLFFCSYKIKSVLLLYTSTLSAGNNEAEGQQGVEGDVTSSDPNHSKQVEQLSTTLD